MKDACSNVKLFMLSAQNASIRCRPRRGNFPGQSFKAVFSGYISGQVFSRRHRQAEAEAEQVVSVTVRAAQQHRAVLQQINSLKAIHWRVAVTRSLRVAVTHMRTHVYSAHIQRTHALRRAGVHVHTCAHARRGCEGLLW